MIPLLLPCLLLAPAPPQEPGLTPEAASAFERWERLGAEAWRLRPDPETGAARLLWGARRDTGEIPRTDAGWFGLGRAVAAEVSPFFGLGPAVLRERAVRRLPLSIAGGTDKVSVQFDQEFAGVPVWGGGLSVLFDTEGRLLAVDATGLPWVESVDIRPAIPEDRARAAALRAYEDLEGRGAEEVLGRGLVIYPWEAAGLRQPRLAWVFELRTHTLDGNGLPSGRRLFVAADGPDAAVLGDEGLVHTCGPASPLAGGDLLGHVQTWATPGTRPDTSSNPEALFALPFAEVSSAAGSTLTDINGDFVIPGAGTNPVDVTVRYRGPLADVRDNQGANHTVTMSFTPGVFDTLTMNDIRDENTTAEANAYLGILDFAAWIDNVDPTDTTMQFPVVANVNIFFFCNAFYAGNNINFFRSGFGCVNTSYSTVVAHEEGHWANDRYGSGNGSDGFGEGNADVFAMYIYDTPIVGEDFSGPGTFVRTGENTRQFCGDGNGGCYGQVHDDGEVLMGALWKVRDNLNQSLGNSAGDLVADSLMVGWMQAFDDRRIESIIEEHWLILDDDDGNIQNGTPNYDAINDGFLAQGFPGVTIGNTDTILLTGPSSAQVGDVLAYTIDGAEPNSPAFLLYSPNLNGSVINGQPFDIGPPVRIAASGTTDAAGAAAFSAGPVPAQGSGLTVFVEAQVDGPSGTADSNALQLDIQ